MTTEERGNGYKIWAVDNAVYGPVELPALISWVQEERVVADTWIYVERDDTWRKAAEMIELQLFFKKDGPRSAAAGQIAPAVLKGITPGAMRRIKVLAELTDTQMSKLAQMLEVLNVPQWSVVVKQGDHGDAMYMVLQGELRVRIMVANSESTLATLNAGECFGEISLFDSGPRSADVIANADSVLLKITSEGLKKLARDSADVAAPFLMATIRTLTARIRADNKRYHDSIHFARTAQ